MDPLKGSRKFLPAPVATAVLLFRASEPAPLAFYPEHFDGDFVVRELHCFVFPGNLADPASATKTTSVANRQWEFHTFVLSGADNYRTYGHCLRFSYSPDANTTLSSNKHVHLDHAIVVLSMFPFFDSLKAWLIPLVKDMLSSVPHHRMSVEPRICSLIHDALVIKSNYIRSGFQLHVPQGTTPAKPLICNFQVPADTSVVPPLSFSMQTFFASVSPNIIVSIWELLLYAGHLLFISSRVSLLTTAAQSCLSLIWPLSWDFAIYIPVLPNQIGLDALNFPNAAIAGMLRSHPEVPQRLEDILEYNEEMMIVDLDDNRILMGDSCRPNRLPPNIREKLIERLKLIFAPNLVLCDTVTPDADGVEGDDWKATLSSFGSSKVKLNIDDQVRVAFLLLLRELCDPSFQNQNVDEFKAAFLASPIYSLYQRNAQDNGILKQLTRMSEDKATQVLLGLFKDPHTPSPFYAPLFSWTPSEAELVPNEAGLGSSDLTFYKSAFPAPNQRINELFNLAETTYKEIKQKNSSKAALTDWVLLQVNFLLKLKRHHDCIRLLGELEADHPIFLCNDLMTVLMDSLTPAELDTMSTRQSGDRLGDAARAFRESKARHQPTTLSPESKELYTHIMTQEDVNAEQKLVDLVTARNVNVNATPGGVSLLNTAVSMGKLRMAACLLRYGAMPDNDTAKNTIAHSLCSTKPRDEVSYLLSIRILCLALASGFNINRGDSYQSTPLTLLCSRPVPFLPLLYFFLHNGADAHALNVDNLPPSAFVIKTRMQQLVDITPVTMLLDMGTNPMISEPSADAFRALISAASDAITNNLQPITTYLENNKYLTAKYYLLRNVKSTVLPSKERQAASAVPSLPLNTSTSAAPGSIERPTSPRNILSSGNVAMVTSAPNISSPGTLPPLKSRTYANITTEATTSAPATSAIGSSAGSSGTDKAVAQKLAESMESVSLANYAIVEAQYRQLVILSALVHRYMPEVGKRKKKNNINFSFGRKKTTPHDAVLSLMPSLSQLLLHHTTLSVDIRHHVTLNGSRPSVAGSLSAKMPILNDALLEYNMAYYASECRQMMDAINSDEMVSIIPTETIAFASLFGPWASEDSRLGNLLVEVLDFPSRLAVLVEDLAKRSAHVQAADTGKIQVLLTQLTHLRNRQDRTRHEHQMAQVIEEVGHKLTGIAQFSFMMAPGSSLLKSGPLKLIRNIDSKAPDAHTGKVPPSEITVCRGYLFATSDETDNKGFLLIACDGAVSERKRIPLKKAVVFDIPSFSFSSIGEKPAGSSSSTSLSSAPSLSEANLLHPIALVALHPSSTPHEYYLLECPSHEAKIEWLSLLWRVCYEGRNFSHKRHLYEHIERNPTTSEFEGWLDYSVDNDFSPAVVTHYFSLRGNRLVAQHSPTENTPIIIIYLDEYSLTINDEPSLRHQLILEPAKHLAPRYLIHFGSSPKLLSKYPASSAYTDWRSLLKHLIPAANASKK